MDDRELRARLADAAEPMPAETRAAVRRVLQAELSGARQVRVVARSPRRRAWLIVAGALTAAAAALAALVLWTRGDDGRLVVSTTPATVTTPPPTSVLPTVGSTAPPSTSSATEPLLGSVALPGGFTVMAMSWPASTEGWAIGYPKDAVGPPTVLRTLDGGAVWMEPAALPPMQEWRSILFADARNGWLLGDALFSTHDGGATWTATSVGTAGFPVAAAAASGTVHVLAADGHVYSSPIDGDDFTASTVIIPLGAGPAPVAQMTAGGPYAAVLVNNRTFAGGAQLANGAWEQWTPPCNWPDGVYTAVAALGPGGTPLALACATSQFGSTPASILALSHGDGALHPLPGADAITDHIPTLWFVDVTAEGTMIAVYDTSVAVSIDAGVTWRVTHTIPAPDYPGAHGLVPGIGYVIVTGPGAGILSADGGLTWQPLGEPVGG